MNRITQKMLEHVVARINTATGSPENQYTKQPDGSYYPNALNYHISSAYGGVMLARMSEKPGCTGITTPLGAYHRPKRELYDQMQAYLAGIEFGGNHHV